MKSIWHKKQIKTLLVLRSTQKNAESSANSFDDEKVFSWPHKKWYFASVPCIPISGVSIHFNNNLIRITIRGCRYDSRTILVHSYLDTGQRR